MLQDVIVGKRGHRYYTAKLKKITDNPSRKGQICDGCGYFYFENEIDFLDGLWLCKKCQKGGMNGLKKSKE